MLKRIFLIFMFAVAIVTFFVGYCPIICSPYFYLRLKTNEGVNNHFGVNERDKKRVNLVNMTEMLEQCEPIMFGESVDANGAYRAQKVKEHAFDFMPTPDPVFANGSIFPRSLFIMARLIMGNMMGSTHYYIIRIFSVCAPPPPSTLCSPQ